jgi:EAL domain-containing protein (putative c-di-GMP-specific phosphodiesterase class I)
MNKTTTAKKAEKPNAAALAKSKNQELVNSPTLQFISLKLIETAEQIRKEFNQESIEELANDIKARGMLQPVLLRPIEGGKFLMIAGERRLRAARFAELENIWAQNDQTRKLTLAVNVSAKQFAIPEFVDSVAGDLKTYRIDPSRLKLTESVMLEDMVGTVEKMHALKKLGLGLSIDDFGIGYSSLSYLKQLPVDQLKIDQSFVQGITKDGSDAMLVQTIIDLAANFHLNVIAEGVETQAQLTFLKHHECMAFQGFLFGMALPVHEFERVLHRIVNELTGSFLVFKPAF